LTSTGAARRYKRSSICLTRNSATLTPKMITFEACDNLGEKTVSTALLRAVAPDALPCLALHRWALDLRRDLRPTGGDTQRVKTPIATISEYSNP